MRDIQLIEFATSGFKEGVEILSVAVPLWVIKDLIDEKKQWVKNNESRGEEPVKHEKWIVDNLTQFLTEMEATNAD